MDHAAAALEEEIASEEWVSAGWRKKGIGHRGSTPGFRPVDQFGSAVRKSGDPRPRAIRPLQPRSDAMPGPVRRTATAVSPGVSPGAVYLWESGPLYAVPFERCASGGTDWNLGR